MSSRDPLWFCHECNAEMQPLMTPDPHCASCRGTFVEKMENTQDDPRTYQQQPMPGGMEEGYPPGMDHFLLGLHHVLNNHGTGRDRAASPTRAPSSPGTTRVELNSGPSGTTRILTFGGPNTLGGGGSNVGGAPPTLSQFLRDPLMAPAAEPSPRPERTDRAAITGPLMAQYLMALLTAQRGAETATRGDAAAGDPLLNIFGRLGLGGGLGGLGLGGLGLGGEGQANGGGRWGDYVFNQEALDEIITQLMENSNSNRPVPATGDIIEGLPRVTLSKDSPLLERDCAVCKDQFALEGEDPAEQIVVTLPCTHPFHEACIVPWIKSSGTCPVCRYALVPQPDQHAHDAPAGGAARAAGSPSPLAAFLAPAPARGPDPLAALLAPAPTPAPAPPAPPIIPQTLPEAPRPSEPPTLPRAPANPPPSRSGGRGSQSGSSHGGFFNALFSGFGGGNRRSSTDSTSQSRRRRSEGAPNPPGSWNGNDS
ncbi:hypothetical protein FIBSPDRAFT_1039331 [Athelia psychrophila]|uniref:RING-type domain-containing protein n=1 Tax=Athelia psychrophila TaxID=1759441 RepID=A0A166S461_9AGAM|nr:hypothetical protein FIBSPDRAFT_1039331 [Fibularhizoctonia sp. CBS 109695]